MTRNRGCFSFLLLLIALSTVALVPLVSAGEAEAASAIASAKQQMVVCYQAAVEAEAAGANITSLADVLNDAGALLSDAELAYSAGDFDIAQSSAAQSTALLNGFVSDANALYDAAVQAGNFDFYVYVVGSTVGAFVVIAVGAAVWFWAKKRYLPDGEGELQWRESD